jgi:hypothetical protein
MMLSVLNATLAGASDFSPAAAIGKVLVGMGKSQGPAFHDE